MAGRRLFPALPGAICGGLAFTALMLSTPAAVAQDLPEGATAQPPVAMVEIPPPILTLDQERLFQGSDWGKAAIDRAEAARSELSRENRTIEAALEEEERALTTRRQSMAPADFAPLATAFDEKVEGIRTAQEAKLRAIVRQLDADQDRFFAEVRPILGALLSERQATAIISDAALIISLSALDVTEDAIRRVNLTLQPPAPEAAPAQTQPEPTPAPVEDAPAP